MIIFVNKKPFATGLAILMVASLRLYGLGILLFSAVYLLIACTAESILRFPGSSSTAPTESSLSVATSTGFIADWVSQVGGDQILAFPVLPEGADPHDFRSGPQDIALLSQTMLFYQVGLGLEAAWVNRLVANSSGGNTRVIALGEYVEILPGDPDELAEGNSDPHFWLDPLLVKLVVSAIAAHLSELDPTQAELFQENAADYNRELEDLHAWISAQVESIPGEHRILVTGHSFMQYFAERYGFEVVGTVTGNTDTDHAYEAPAHDLAELATHIQEMEIRAIFTEYGHENELTQRVAEEAGIRSVTPLFTGSLGPEGSGADSYIGMMMRNVEALVEVLQ